MKTFLFATLLSTSLGARNTFKACTDAHDCSCATTQSSTYLTGVQSTTTTCTTVNNFLGVAGNTFLKRTSACNANGFLVTTLSYYKDATCTGASTHSANIIADGKCHLTRSTNADNTYFSYYAEFPISCTPTPLSTYSDSECTTLLDSAANTLNEMAFVAPSSKWGDCVKTNTNSWSRYDSVCNDEGYLESTFKEFTTLDACQYTAGTAKLITTLNNAATTLKHTGRCTKGDNGANPNHYIIPETRCHPVPKDADKNIKFWETTNCLGAVSTTTMQTLDFVHTKECVRVGTTSPITSTRISSHCNLDGHPVTVKSFYNNEICAGSAEYIQEFIHDNACHTYVADGEVKSYQVTPTGEEVTKCNDDFWNVYTSNDCSGIPLQGGSVPEDPAVEFICKREQSDFVKYTYGCTEDGLFMTSKKVTHSAAGCSDTGSLSFPEFIHDGNCHVFDYEGKRYSYLTKHTVCRAPQTWRIFVDDVDDDKTGIIVAIVFGSVFFIAIVAVLIWCACSSSSEPASEEIKH
eukprot:TRINITY_DN97_c10_g1_i1.p2 TRINITY_DN97_c10_g1~~TRINITY_DN97_c10_g1_i1.p2  ORF type:complete len:520 (+),score=102.78 TRINITY_DN97_c10_g1_i1:1953-3512(+)